MYRYSGQRCIRKDLIEKELNIPGVQFHQQKLSNRFLDWLFRHYKTHEFTIHFYDDEPKLRDDIDYDDPWWETSEGIEYVRSKFREHEERRMTFNNWIDVFGEGIWSWTQKQVDQFAREHLEVVKDWPVKKKDRVYCGFKEDYIYIYCYGRDFLGDDLWFIMHKGDNGWKPIREKNRKEYDELMGVFEDDD